MNWIMVCFEVYIFSNKSSKVMKTWGLYAWLHVACSTIILFMQVNNATPRPKHGPMVGQSNRGNFHGTACCSKDETLLHVAEVSCMLHVARNVYYQIFVWRWYWKIGDVWYVVALKYTSVIYKWSNRQFLLFELCMHLKDGRQV